MFDPEIAPLPEAFTALIGRPDTVKPWESLIDTPDGQLFVTFPEVGMLLWYQSRTEMENGQQLDAWVLSAISYQDLQDIKDNSLPISDALCKTWSFFGVYNVTCDRWNLWRVPGNSIPNSYLPQAGVTLHPSHDPVSGIRVGHVYRHFKGSAYLVTGVRTRVTSGQDGWEVTYALCGVPQVEFSTDGHRFLGTVTRNEVTKPRFEHVGPPIVWHNQQQHRR